MGTTALVMRPWSRLGHAELATLRYRVNIVLEGIPPHAWREDTAAKILTPSCWIQDIDMSTVPGEDLSSFKVTAWTAHPSYIPLICWLGVAEDEAPRHLFAGGPPLPPYLREKKTLGYKVLIHIRTVADFNPRPPSPPPGGSPPSDDGDSGHLSGRIGCHPPGPVWCGRSGGGPRTNWASGYWAGVGRLPCSPAQRPPGVGSCFGTQRRIRCEPFDTHHHNRPVSCGPQHPLTAGGARSTDQVIAQGGTQRADPSRHGQPGGAQDGARLGVIDDTCHGSGTRGNDTALGPTTAARQRGINLAERRKPGHAVGPQRGEGPSFGVQGHDSCCQRRQTIHAPTAGVNWSGARPKDAVARRSVSCRRAGGGQHLPHAAGSQHRAAHLHHTRSRLTKGRTLVLSAGG